MELLRRFSFLVLLVSLVSCGGGTLSDDGNGTGGTNPDPIVISLALSNQNVTGQNPVTVSATVTQGNSPVAGKVVTFASTLGAFSPSSATALTDSAGIATITLTAGSVRGAGTITASLSTGESQEIGFTTQGDDIGVVGDININVSLIDANGETTQTITSSKPGRVIATIEGISVPVIVTFESTVGDIPIPSAITNESNQAIVDILAGSTLGAGTVTATISSGESGQVLLVVGATSLQMGSGSPFVEGEADISLAQISAGGTTVVSVNIIDDQGNPFTEPVDVNFSSSCTSQGTATLSSPISTSNGTATSTYLAKGCVGDDPINVTANAGGINLSATASVNVLPADVGSIEFISVFPEQIGILGTGALGGSESAIVKFKVLDTNSNPVNNQVVNFALNTDVGGIQLIPTSATTNSEGIVQTVINSGTVATTVRVQATIADSDPVISSQSSLLVVSTGVPDQDSFDLSASVLNPEAWNISGTEVTITARLADAFNNPVPDGTAVSFTTEGGSIEPSCTTENGICTVTWRSQNPRPEGHVLGDINNPTHQPEEQNTMGQKYGGRATILATVIGEESFPDLNGNGRFDESEVSAFNGTNISGEDYDLKEAFIDHNEDGFYNPSEGNDVNESGALEEFVDFNNDGAFSGKDGKYNGVLCAIPTHVACSDQKSLYVRRQLVLVMSTSSGKAVVTATNDAVSPTYDDDNDPNTPEVANPDFNATDSRLVIAGENTGSVSLTIADFHNQPMPAGTVVTATATAGSVVSGGTWTWPNDNHNGGVSLSIGVKGEQEPKSGTLFIEAEAPSGLVTPLAAIPIIIQ